MFIDGKKLAAELLVGLQKEFAVYNGLKIAVIVAGENPVILSFIKQKEKIARTLGVDLLIISMPETANENDFANEIKKLNGDNNINGIIVQLPLPDRFDREKILSVIAPEKDIDGLGPSQALLTPSVRVCQFIFARYSIDLFGKKIIILGQGRLVGKPIAGWLASQNTRVSVINKDTPEDEKERLIKSADILISGVGKAGLVEADWIKSGAVVIDFGCDFKDGKIAGDVVPQAGERAGLFTPTPGGAGPILVAMLFRNFLDLINAKQNA